MPFACSSKPEPGRFHEFWLHLRQSCETLEALKISIVIPAFNEEQLIGVSLERLRAAARSVTVHGWEHEIIVCDNNSTDRTAELARAAGAKVVFDPINQISRARNTGARAAAGDWLLFVDADSHPTPELLEDVIEQIESGRCLAGGSTIQLERGYFVATLVTRGWNFVSRWKRLLAGSFIFCDATVFRQIGGFSHELFAGEELDLSKRLHEVARRTGRQIVILDQHPLHTSARKMRLYSATEHLRFLVRAIFRSRSTLRSREACHSWYDGRR